MSTQHTLVSSILNWSKFINLFLLLHYLVNSMLFRMKVHSFSKVVRWVLKSRGGWFPVYFLVFWLLIKHCVTFELNSNPSSFCLILWIDQRYSTLRRYNCHHSIASRWRIRLNICTSIIWKVIELITLPYFRLWSSLIIHSISDGQGSLAL